LKGAEAFSQEPFKGLRALLFLSPLKRLYCSLSRLYYALLRLFLKRCFGVHFFFLQTCLCYYTDPNNLGVQKTLNFDGGGLRVAKGQESNELAGIYIYI